MLPSLDSFLLLSLMKGAYQFYLYFNIKVMLYLWYIITSLGKVDQSKVNIVYKEIREGVTEDTISHLIEKYGMDVVLSTIVSSVGTTY